ncbi:hypothetical protein HPB47_018423 [Ixodes persulcatus]|uniref:Uncharacterized protein n=1 Tax=Ixodes persulcatus TaxID=34615 RepID=A0AC60QLK0_IXOPE|nr:hypothetical protein HPB47_018423 [Ixodes persulcatus]
MATGTPSLTASQKTRTELYSMPPSTCGSSIAELENEASVTNLAEVRAPDHGPHITPPNAEMLTSDMEIADTDQGEWYDAKTSKNRKKNSIAVEKPTTATARVPVKRNARTAVKLTLPRPLPAQNGREKSHRHRKQPPDPFHHIHPRHPGPGYNPGHDRNRSRHSRPATGGLFDPSSCHTRTLIHPFFVNTFAHLHVHRTYSYSRKRTILRSPFPDINPSSLQTPPTESPRSSETEPPQLNTISTTSLSNPLRKALNAAGGSPLVIGGDFNLPHTGWGYKHCSAEGRNLWQDSHDLGFTLITDPTFHTRLGTSTARDTTPDLAFTKNVVNAQWRNTQYDLGSDHLIIEITLPHLTALSRITREFAFVDWDAFRKHRTEKAADTSITDIESWSRDLQSDTQLATRTIKTDVPTERIDSRLAHLIEAKTSILSRWKGQRLNKQLRKKVALLNKDIEEHCRVLNQQQWVELCNSLDGQLHRSRSWKILKHLLDNTTTRSQQQDRLTKLLFTETKAHGKDHYIPSGSARPHGPYTGSSNSALDEDFSVAEVHAALRKLNSRSAPGPDCVTNKTLRNLDDPSVEQLTEYINDCWRQGSIPL